MISQDLTGSTEMGLDASGIVKRVGKKVSSVTIGDRVAALCIGAIRSIIHTQENLIKKLPENMSMEEGASLPAAYSIAYQAVCEAGRLTRGESILIHNAAGGV